MNTSELLHRIAKDRIKGMRTIDSYQLQPVIVDVSAPDVAIDLKNDIWMLNTRFLPDHITTLEMISSDNVFVVTKQEYDFMDEYRFQTFTDYIDIKISSQNFQPFRLEFVKIIPHRN